jgi:hypothetical protein
MAATTALALTLAACGGGIARETPCTLRVQGDAASGVPDHVLPCGGWDFSKPTGTFALLDGVYGYDDGNPNSPALGAWLLAGTASGGMPAGDFAQMALYWPPGGPLPGAYDSTTPPFGADCTYCIQNPAGPGTCWSVSDPAQARLMLKGRQPLALKDCPPYTSTFVACSRLSGHLRTVLDSTSPGAGRVTLDWSF